MELFRHKIKVYVSSLGTFFFTIFTKPREIQPDENILPTELEWSIDTIYTYNIYIYTYNTYFYVS